MAPTALQIKTSALSRLIKEEKLYAAELKEQEALVQSMKSLDADEYDLKKQEEILAESHRMLPEIAAKIKSHRDALKAYLDENPDEGDTAAARNLL